MTYTAASQKAIDEYLATLRRQLRDLMDEDVRDIVEEIHAHLLDKTAGDPSPEKIASALSTLGSPQQLALRYHTDELLERAQLHRSPGLLLRGFVRGASLGVGGLLVFMLSGVGYCIGGVIFVMGLMKAFLPKRAGLNILRDAHTWSVGFGASSGPQTGHDPIGLWLIPICLALGGAILFLTFRFSLWMLRFFTRPGHVRAPIAVED